MNKLLNVPIEPYKAVFGFYTNKGNRIALKIIKGLKKVPGFKIKEEITLIEARFFEMVIETTLDKPELKTMILTEIVALIPDNFPVNYCFDFSKTPALGFINSFYIINSDGVKIITLFHRIKEARRDGKSAAFPSTPNIVF